MYQNRFNKNDDCMFKSNRKVINKKEIFKTQTNPIRFILCVIQI